MWKKFSGNFSCDNFLWVSMENEIYKIRPQTKDNKTKGWDENWDCKDRQKRQGPKQPIMDQGL